MSIPVIAAIRGEILSGRPLLVLEPHSNEGSPLSQAARNACHVAGRLGDLVTLDATAPMPEATLCRDASRRRVDLQALSSLPAGTLFDAFQACAFGSFAKASRKRSAPNRRDAYSRFDLTSAFDASPFNPLPVVPLNAFRKSNPVVVIHGGWREMMALAWGFVVTTGEDGLPLIAANGLDLSHIADPLGLDVQSFVRATLASRPEALGRALAHDDARWESARAGALAGFSVESGPGYALARHDGTLACAIRAVGHPSREDVLLVRTDASGWCEGAWLECDQAVPSGLPGGMLGELSAMALGGGVRSVTDREERARTGHVVRRMAGDIVSDLEAVNFVPRPVLDAILGASDGPLVRACLSTADPTVAFGWAGGNQRRRQFALGTPAFLHYALETDLSRAVDDAQPTAPILAARLSLSRGMVRRLSGARMLPGEVSVESPRYGRRVRTEFSLPVLRAIGTANVPNANDGGEWSAFCACVSAVEKAYVPHDAVARMLVDLGPDWKARLAGIERLGTNAIADVADLVRVMTGLLERMGGRRTLDPMDVCRMLAGNGSLERLCRVSVRWHGHPVLARLSGSLPAETTWPVPFATLDLGEGWSATCIGSAKALYDEGSPAVDSDGLAGLDHCVATYASACQTGASLVVSIRYADARGPRRISTAEFRPTKARAGNWSFRGTPMELVQHRGRDNAEPSSPAGDALARLSALVSGSGAPVDRNALSPRAPLPARALPERDMELFEMWRPFLPKRHARLSPEALIDLIQARRHAAVEPPEALRRTG